MEKILRKIQLTQNDAKKIFKNLNSLKSMKAIKFQIKNLCTSKTSWSVVFTDKCEQLLNEE